MAFVDSVKRIPVPGARRVGQAVAEFEPPWARRRRRRLRLKWAVGFAVGLLVVAATVLWALYSGLLAERD